MENQVLICRCQEVTEAEIVRAIRQNDLRTLQEVKRHTRAGMGLCQGQTCGYLVMGILARETNQQRCAITPDTSRPPVRPVRIGTLANRVIADD